MRLTLVDVLGEERGYSMYTLEWLANRVRFHLDPTLCVGEVIIAEDNAGTIVGHTIVRVEVDDEQAQFGLFSTFYVVPEFRGQGIAGEFVRTGETWMTEHGLSVFRTYTAHDNFRLHKLMAGHGYEIELTKDDMVSLRKCIGEK